MRRERWGMGLAAVALVGLAGLAGCGGSAGDGSAKGDGASAGRVATAEQAARALPDELKGPKVGQQAGRLVVYEGTLRVRVDDAEAAADDARQVATRAGGYLASQDADLEGDQEVTLTLRVPAEEFDAVAADLAELGDVLDRTVSSEDVTASVVDLEGRLENARTSATRLRELLAEAENIANITTLEDKLTVRETEIEALSGQIEVLRDQAALSSLDVTLTEAAPKADAVSRDLPGPLEALRSGAIALANLLLVVLAVVFFLLPFAPFAVLAWWLRRRVLRRRAARRPVADDWPTAPEPPPAPVPADLPPPPGPAPRWPGDDDAP